MEVTEELFCHDTNVTVTRLQSRHSPAKVDPSGIPAPKDIQEFGPAVGGHEESPLPG